MTVTWVDVAKRLAAAGYVVFPVRAGSKRAAVAWGALKPGISPEQIDAWGVAFPNANLALGMGRGLVAVDVDTKKGANPTPFFGTTPVVARTPSGGAHFVYRLDHRAPTKADVVPGIDLRGDGGYIIIEPSADHRGAWRWGEGALEALLQHRELPHASIVAKLLQPKPIPGADEPPPGDEWISKLLHRGVGEGSRNASLAKLAGYLCGKELPFDVVLALLRGWNARLSKPLDDEEVVATVRSIARRAKRNVVDSTATDVQPVLFRAFQEEWAGFEAGWLVEDWLPQRTIGMAYGPPGCLKSWFVYDLAASVALGRPFLGRFPVQQGPVLLVQGEDPPWVIEHRLDALVEQRWVEEHGSRVLAVTDEGIEFSSLSEPDPPLYVYAGHGLQLSKPTGMQLLERWIAKIQPSLVILDPLYALCGSDDFMADAVPMVGQLKELRANYPTTFLLAHHTSKRGGDNARRGREKIYGSNLLNAAIETGWDMTRIRGGGLRVKPHFKVMESPTESHQFDVVIDFDADDDCVFKVTDREETIAPEAQQDEGALLDALASAITSSDGSTRSVAKHYDRTLSMRQVRRLLLRGEELGRWARAGTTYNTQWKVNHGTQP